MTTPGGDLPSTICAPGDHVWQNIAPVPLPEADTQPDTPTAMVATHRCSICGVVGMMEILNDGRPQRRP
jgi:hypothetical protein